MRKQVLWKQREVIALDYIRNTMKTRHYFPSLKEIGHAMRCCPATVAVILHRLDARGLVELRGGQWRKAILTKKGWGPKRRHAASIVPSQTNPWLSATAPQKALGAILD